MLKDIKLLACDIDGTILNSKNELTKVTKNALQKVIDNNILLVLSTGRAFNAIDPKIMEINGIKFAICSNGAVIYDVKTKRPIYSDEMQLDVALKILKTAMKYEVCPAVFVKSSAYTVKKIYDSPIEFGLSKHLLEYFKTTRVPVENILSFLEKKNSPVEKIFLILKNLKEKQKIMEELKQFEDVFVTTSGINNIEILNKTADKSSAVKFIADRLKINKSNIVSAGDSPNDIGMFKASGFSIAMGNAFKEAKESASVVVDTNDNNGLAKAIDKYIFNK